MRCRGIVDEIIAVERVIGIDHFRAVGISPATDVTVQNALVLYGDDRVLVDAVNGLHVGELDYKSPRPRRNALGKPTVNDFSVNLNDDVIDADGLSVIDVVDADGIPVKRGEIAGESRGEHIVNLLPAIRVGSLA